MNSWHDPRWPLKTDNFGIFLYVHLGSFDQDIVPKVPCIPCIAMRETPTSSLKHVHRKTNPRKLTWQWKLPIFNRKYIFKWLIFQCHVSFQGCIEKNTIFLVVCLSMFSHFQRGYFQVRSPQPTVFEYFLRQVGCSFTMSLGCKKNEDKKNTTSSKGCIFSTLGRGKCLYSHLSVKSNEWLETGPWKKMWISYWAWETWTFLYGQQC